MSDQCLTIKIDCTLSFACAIWAAANRSLVVVIRGRAASPASSPLLKPKVASRGKIGEGDGLDGLKSALLRQVQKETAARKVLIGRHLWHRRACFLFSLGPTIMVYFNCSMMQMTLGMMLELLLWWRTQGFQQAKPLSLPRVGRRCHRLGRVKHLITRKSGE